MRNSIKIMSVCTFVAIMFMMVSCANKKTADNTSVIAETSVSETIFTEENVSDLVKENVMFIDGNFIIGDETVSVEVIPNAYDNADLCLSTCEDMMAATNISRSALEQYLYMSGFNADIVNDAINFVITESDPSYFENAAYNFVISLIDNRAISRNEVVYNVSMLGLFDITIVDDAIARAEVEGLLDFNEEALEATLELMEEGETSQERLMEILLSPLEGGGRAFDHTEIEYAMSMISE